MSAISHAPRSASRARRTHESDIALAPSPSLAQLPAAAVPPPPPSAVHAAQLAQRSSPAAPARDRATGREKRGKRRAASSVAQVPAAACGEDAQRDCEGERGGRSGAAEPADAAARSGAGAGARRGGGARKGATGRADRPASPTAEGYGALYSRAAVVRSELSENWNEARSKVAPIAKAAGREETPELEEGELPPGDVESGGEEPAAAAAKVEEEVEEDTVSLEPFLPSRSAPRTPERTPERPSDEAAEPACSVATEAPALAVIATSSESSEEQLRKRAGATARARELAEAARAGINEPARTASQISLTTDWDPSEDMNESEHSWSRDVSIELRGNAGGELPTIHAQQDAYAQGDRGKDGEEEELAADSWELEASAYGLDIMEAALGDHPDDDDTQEL